MLNIIEKSSKKKIRLITQHQKKKKNNFFSIREEKLSKMNKIVLG